MENNPSQLIVEITPKDIISPITVNLQANRTSFVNVILTNLIPGTSYTVLVTALSLSGKCSDPFELQTHTKLANPQITITGTTSDAVQGFVSINGRYQRLQISIDPKPKRFGPSLKVLHSKDYMFDFQMLVSGEKYEIIASATLDNGEKLRESVEVTLPCSPVFSKRQVILESGWVLLALRVDSGGEWYSYKVETGLGYYKEDERMVRQEIRLKFPPELFGKMLNSSVSGFLTCDSSLIPIAIGVIDSVEIVPKFQTGNCFLRFV